MKSKSLKVKKLGLYAGVSHPRTGTVGLSYSLHKKHKSFDVDLLFVSFGLTWG